MTDVMIETTGRETRDAIRLRKRVAAVAAGVAAPLIVWAVAEYALGVTIQSPAFGPDQPSQLIGAEKVALMGLLAGLAGWGLLAALERYAERARTIWTVIASAVLLISLGGPLSGTELDAATRVTLLAMHLAVALAVIPAMRRSTGTPSS